MRVLNIGSSDIGGQSIRIKRAFDRHAPGWVCNSVVRNRNYIDYPVDRPFRDAPELARRADVVHAHNSFKAARQGGALGKPLVITHHGTRFRRDPAGILGEQRAAKALGLVSTLDLWLLAPDDTEWSPSLYDLDWLAGMRRPVRGRKLRIGHAPTDRAVKSTDAVLAACKKLGREIPVEVVLVERQSWRQCLAAKARCDIFVDQVLLGYGNNAIEAWGMGIPVVCGATDDTLTEYERRFGVLPFVRADEGTIYHALATLAEPTTRETWSQIGLAHVRRWHDDATVVTHLQDIYRRAAERTS